jgi:hypothetical protein
MFTTALTIGRATSEVATVNARNSVVKVALVFAAGRKAEKKMLRIPISLSLCLLSSGVCYATVCNIWREPFLSLSLSFESACKAWFHDAFGLQE